MADKVVFDPQKLQSGSLVDCQEQQLLELAKSCAVLPRRNAAKTASGAVFARGIYVAEDGRVKVGKAGKAGENGWTKLELEYMAPRGVLERCEESAAADVCRHSAYHVCRTQRRQASVCRGRRAERAEKRAHALRRRMSGDSFPMPEGGADKLLAILKRALAFEPAAL